MTSKEEEGGGVTKHPPEPNLSPSPKSIPTTLSRSYIINKNIQQTEFVIQLFSDRIFIGITQLPSGRIGTILNCSVEDSIIDNSRTYNVTTLLGLRDDPLLEVYARQITERIASLAGGPGIAGGGRGGGGGGGGIGSLAPCPPILFGMGMQKEKSSNNSLGEHGRDPETFKTIVDIVLGMYTEAIHMAS